MAVGRSLGNHGSKGRPFRLALPQADYSDNSGESKRAQITFFSAISNSLSTWAPHGPKFLPGNPTKKVVLPSRIFLPSGKQSLKLSSAVPRI